MLRVSEIGTSPVSQQVLVNVTCVPFASETGRH